MAVFAIPEPNREGFRVLARMPAEDYEALASALQSVGPAYDTRDFVSELGRASGLAPDELAPVVTASLSGAGLMTAQSLTADVFADSLDLSSLGLGNDEDQRLRARLREVLGNRVLRLTSRIVESLYSDERVYLGARIFTDWRPVFMEANEAEVGRPSAGIVIHQLQVEFLRHGRRESTAFGLDSSDLESLRDLADRALEEGNVLQQVMVETNIPTVGPSGEE